jgi:hypothetical protein
VVRKILNSIHEYWLPAITYAKRKDASNVEATPGPQVLPAWAHAMKGESDPKDDEHKAAERCHWRFQNATNVATVIIALIAMVAAIASTIYSHDQADTANRTLTEVQRAFIVLDKVQVNRYNDSGESKVTISLDIKNSGATPTRNLFYFIQNGVGEFFGEIPRRTNDIILPNVPGDPAKIFYVGGDEIFKGWQRSFAVVGPQGRLIINDIEFPSRTWANSKDVMRLHKTSISGVIVYNDVFPFSERHITKFCYFIYPETWRVQECGYWNCADKECDRDIDAYNAELRASYRRSGKEPPSGILSHMDWLRRPDLPILATTP